MKMMVPTDEEQCFAAVDKIQSRPTIVAMVLVEILAAMVKRSMFKTDRIDDYREEVRELKAQLAETIIEFSRARVIITNHIRLTRSEYLDIKAIKAGIASDE